MKESDESPSIELDDLVSKHPDIEYVDAIFADLHGYIRGKRIPVGEAGKIYKSGIQIPDSAFLLDPLGDSGDPCGRGYSDGDPDGTLKTVPGTTCLVPWGVGKSAQVLMELYGDDGTANLVDPRHIAARAVSVFGELGYKLNIAFELEFYLLDKDFDDHGKPVFPGSHGKKSSEHPTQVYSLKDLDQQYEFLSRVQEACRVQGIPVSAAVSEYSPFQFEINLHHTPDPMSAADHCVLLRRVIKEIALSLDMVATFMPKPFHEFSGNGMHLHVSMENESGDNVFRGEDELGSTLMHKAIGGLLDSMADMIAVFAPGHNSFKRFVPDIYVPVTKTWGFNNRSVTIRIPAGDDDARRIEHRIAGADANPYLVLTAILGGMHHGITNSIDAGEASPFTNVGSKIDETLPFRWDKAIDAFEKSQFAQRYFTRDYVELYCAVKRDEMLKFDQYINDREYQFYL